MTLSNRIQAALILVLVLAACSPAPTSVAPTEPSTQAPTVTPMPTATPGPTCPEPTEGTVLLTREAVGYCLLYPEGYTEVDTEPAQVCLVPGDPGGLACHGASALVNVEAANGRSADQVAEAMIANADAQIPGIVIRHTSLEVSGEPAVMLEGLPGVASTRVVLVVHGGRLYMLTFIPWDKAGEEFARLETLFATILDSFTFLPAE